MKEDKISKQRSNATNYYSFFIALFPILCIYDSRLPGLTAGDVCLGIFLFYAVVSKSEITRKTKASQTLLLLMFYYFTMMLLSVFFQIYAPMTDMLVRLIRFVFYIFCVLFVSNRFFSYELASKWVVRISLLASIYILTQYILYYGFSYVLSGYIKILPIYLKEYADKDYYNMYNLLFFRPTSFFLEPAQYSQYAVVGLCVSLFTAIGRKYKSILTSIVISAGIIFSTSMQGILCTVALWLVWGVSLYYRERNIKKFSVSILAIISISSILLVAYNTEVVQNAIARFGSTNNSAVSARLGGFTSIENLNGVFRYIGFGFGQVPNNTWMSSAAFILYGTGVIGLILTVLFFSKSFFSTKEFTGKILCLIFFVFFWEAAIFTGYMFVFYFSFIFFSMPMNPDIIKNRIETYQANKVGA